jgi:tetratricopeptide (TPR) repeat protein
MIMDLDFAGLAFSLATIFHQSAVLTDALPYVEQSPEIYNKPDHASMPQCFQHSGHIDMFFGDLEKALENYRHAGDRLSRMYSLFPQSDEIVDAVAVCASDMAMTYKNPGKSDHAMFFFKRIMRLKKNLQS